MANIPQDSVLLDKKIQQNRIISIVLLFIFMGAVGVAFYYFNEHKKANTKIGNLSTDLQNSNEIITIQDSLINAQKEIKLAKDSQDQTIKLLKVLLNDTDTVEYTTKRILANLTEIAKDKEAEIEKRNDDKKRMIKNIFSMGNLNRRASNTDHLLKQYGHDANFLRLLFTYVLDDKQLQKGNLDSYYQVVYILNELNDSDLAKYEKEILTLESKMKKMNTIEAGWYGPKTKGEFNTIRNKIKKASS